MGFASFLAMAALATAGAAIGHSIDKDHGSILGAVIGLLVFSVSTF